MDKFKYISLDLTNESRNKLMQMLPNLHAFQNALGNVNNSRIHLYGTVLLRESYLNHEDTKELATDLANKYFEYIKNGQINYKVRLTHIGWDDCVMSFKCNGDLIGIEDKQLLVIATYNYHNAREARSITHWLELKPIEMDAVLTVHKR